MANSSPTSPDLDPDEFNPSASRYYNPTVARSLFEAGGQFEEFSAGTKIFGEGDIADKRGLFSKSRPHRMFLLTEGEVALTAHGKLVDTIRPGGIFGEMAVISELPGTPAVPRTATATANTASMAYSLDVKETETALERAPEFALMLMSVMFDRLRFLAARLATRRAAIAVRQAQAPVFDPALLAQLAAALARPVVARYPAGGTIMREGQAGMVMYVVKSGRVAISLGDHVVEIVGPGGTFGEMALVDQSPRVANAAAAEECELLAVDRAALLDAVKLQPAFAMAMLRSIADRLRHMNAHLA